jgi:hypothetical protein
VEATAATWRHGIYGGEHYAETLIHGFSGGGGGATVNGKSVFDAVSKVIDWKSEQKMALAPNPTTGVFSIYLAQAAKKGLTIRVTESTGRYVLENPVEPGAMQQRIDVGSLPAGLYFLQMVLDGKTLVVEKFVKE